MYHYVFGHPGRITRVFCHPYVSLVHFFVAFPFPPKKKQWPHMVPAIQRTNIWWSSGTGPGRRWCEGELEELGQGTGSRARRGETWDSHVNPTWFSNMIGQPPMNGPGGILSQKYIVVQAFVGDGWRSEHEFWAQVFLLTLAQKSNDPTDLFWKKLRWW